MIDGKYITDYHAHSTCSPDGRNTMLEMARAAIAHGVDEVCFTDHVEPLKWIRWNDGTEPEHDWAKHTAQFEEAKSALGERIKLRLGAELGEVTFATDVADRLLSTAPPLDFTIGSVHTFWRNGRIDDLTWVESDDYAEWNDVIARYLTEVRRIIAWGRFNVLGHLTLPLRYACEEHGMKDLSFDPFADEVEDILKSLIGKGLGIELNTNRGHEPLPGEKWLRLYRELGGEIITLGSDAHTPAYIGCAMAQRQELLKDCGFRYFCTFDGQKPVFHKL